MGEIVTVLSAVAIAAFGSTGLWQFLSARRARAEGAAPPKDPVERTGQDTEMLHVVWQLSRRINELEQGQQADRATHEREREADRAEWQAALEKLRRENRALRGVLLGVRDRLTQIPPGTVEDALAWLLDNLPPEERTPS